MNALETLYFPDTTIFTDRQFPLFLFFSSVHIIQPVEADETVSEESKLTDTFMDEGFCQVHTPAPLGKDRTRFLRLINDIKNRKDDYAAQLSALTVASMSAPRNLDDNSKRTIISSLLGNSSVDSGEKDQIAVQEKLWQARLVLKIAEMLDQEEEEIAHALTFLDDTELDLFSRLQGKDEEFAGNNPYEELTQLKKRMNQPRIETIKNRFRAWSTLMQMQDQPTCPIWATTRTEAADIVFENYEKKTGAAALPLLATELPARIGKSPEQSLEKITAFKKESQTLLAELVEKLETILQRERGNDNFTLLPEKEEWEGRWKTLLESHFPEQLHGRISLSFHLLANRQPASLFSEPEKESSGHGIVAVVGGHPLSASQQV